MKATGIVRRIDDLGRVVIPKEIRRTMRIREGDPLEIYTDRDGEVIFKKYSPLGELASFASHLCDVINKTTGFACAISDRDAIISAAGISRRDVMEKRVSDDVERIMESRQIYRAKPGERPILLCEGAERYLCAIAAPIICEGDISGCVAILESEGLSAPGDSEFKVVQTIAAFLGKQMEN